MVNQVLLVKVDVARHRARHPGWRESQERKKVATMAKLNAPLMSLGASGEFGKEIVYSHWKGINYARELVIPMNPNSAAQQVIRGYFTASVDAWHAETSTVRTAWTDYAKTQSLAESGYNLYVGKYIKFLVGHSGTPPTVTNTPPTMS